jgi:cytidylate kinase
MPVYIAGQKYVPGMYVKRRPEAHELADQYMRDWELRRPKMEERRAKPEMPPTICFSRKIGVGALEIADILAEQIGYRVADREVLEHIAREGRLSARTVAFFDERYPGAISEFLSMLFGEKAFIESDYARRLISTVISFAMSAPTIFVGRGTHLVLPRQRVLAVRFIGSRSYRTKRLANILNIAEKEVNKKIDEIDKEQRDFFKKVYGKKEASPYEFDLVVNCDHLDLQSAAGIAAQAFKQKFGVQTTKREKAA